METTENTMTPAQRDTINHLTALQGERPHNVNGHLVRRIDISTISVLGLVGSPFAAYFTAALNGEQPPSPRISAQDIAILTWACSAPEDDVLDVALQCAPGLAEPALAAALRFIRGWSEDDLLAVISKATEDSAAIRAANFSMAIPHLSGSGKKKA